MNHCLQRNLTADELNTYRRDGVVCLRQIMVAPSVDVIRNAIDYQRAHPGSYSSFIQTPNSYVFVEQMASLFNDQLRRLVLESGVADIPKKLLGLESIRWVYDQTFYKESESREIIETPWHQDTPGGNMRGMNVVRLWIPVDTTPRQTALEFVRGSHLWNVEYRSIDLEKYKNEKTDGASYYFDRAAETSPEVPDIESMRDSFDIIGFDVEPGDVIAFNYNMLHRGGGGKSPTTKRRAYGIVYSDDTSVMLNRPNFVPNPITHTGGTFKDGQSVAEFPEVFPAV